MAGTKFHSRTSGLGGAVFRNATMKEVLAQSADGGAYADLGRYVVAALLNSAAGRTPFLSQTTVRQMWNDVVSKGSYEPTAGVPQIADALTASSRIQR
jgi:hypothetical protein